MSVSEACSWKVGMVGSGQGVGWARCGVDKLWGMQGVRWTRCGVDQVLGEPGVEWTRCQVDQCWVGQVWRLLEKKILSSPTWRSSMVFLKTYATPNGGADVRTHNLSLDLLSSLGHCLLW